jgi:hypothetical protein
MALGMTEWSGTLTGPDDASAGELSWATTSGVPPTSPMVGGPDVAGLGQFDVDRGFSRVVTVPGSGDPASGALAGVPGVELMDDWRDLFNFRGSPMPWLLLLALVMLGVMSMAMQGRVGPARVSASVG